MDRPFIYRLIEQEVITQEMKWGKNTEGTRQQQHPLEWWVIFCEEVGEAAKALNEWHFRGAKDTDFVYELVQALAVGVSMLEALEGGA